MDPWYHQEGWIHSPQVSFLAAGGNSAALMTLASLLRRRWPHLVYEDVLKTAQVASETDPEKRSSDEMLNSMVIGQMKLYAIWP